MEFHVTVERIVDGDTIEVAFRNGDIADVRLLGVDTPEVHTTTDPAEFEGIPDTEAGHAHLREWGERASDFAADRLQQGEQIRIVVDEQADRRGAFGRLLVYLYDDGDLFNRLLLEQGYARLYESSFSKRSAFARAETTAREDGVGLWDYEAPTATPTATPASGSGELAVAEVHADAPGNDHENLNEEYVVFENVGGESLDLSGWTVADGADHTYTVPDGFTLRPGEQVTLYTGSGDDSATELYWGSGRAIWNNGGDTVFVRNGAGNLVIEHEYDG